MATIKDVARLAGVSVATVSRVINNSPKASEASRLAVHSAMESLSYHPNANARALAQQTTETVGLIVGDVSDPFFGAMVKAVEQVAYHTSNFLLIGRNTTFSKGIVIPLQTIFGVRNRVVRAQITNAGMTLLN